MHTSLNGISEFSKLLFARLRKRAKAQKAIAIVLFTIACILGSVFPLPLISFSGSSTAIAQTRQDRKAEGDHLFREGFRQLNTSQFQAALQSFQQALEVYQQIGDRQGEAYALFGTGRIYSSTGQYQQAIKVYQYALSIFKDTGYRVGEGTTLNSIGMVYYRLGQYPQALDVFQQVLVIWQEVGEYPGETLNNIGLVYADLGQYSQALESFQQALATHRRFGNRSGECTTLNNIGTVYRDRGQYPQALESFQQALVISREIGDRAQEGIVLAGIGGVYDDLGQYKQALDTLGQALVIARDIGDRLSEGNTLNNIAAVYADLGQYRQALDFYQQALAIAKAIGDRPISDLVTTSREAIGVRNRSEPATIVPELKPEAQQRQQAQQRQKLQQLHQLLIEPITKYLPTNPDERVIFIPQGELFLVPFPALVDAQGKYLIEKHTILTAPSIQVLDLTRQQRQLVGANSDSPIRGDDVLVVGNPIMPKVWNPTKGIKEQLSSLPGAEEEAVTIAKVFAKKPLLWEQASESAVVQRMPEARIIHLSTHGLLEYGNPQDSGVRDFPGAIALSPSAKDDGLLTSAEILKMKLKAELVVLSACDTGRGRITGDGVIGLSRSLITAGVPSVIVSLWSVPDAPTAELMSEFYRQWQQHPDKAKALRQAMLITMQNHPNPRDWAAFTLIGEAE